MIVIEKTNSLYPMCYTHPSAQAVVSITSQPAGADRWFSLNNKRGET